MINNSDLKLFAHYKGTEFGNTKIIHDSILILGGHHPCLPYNRKNKYGVDCPPNKDLKDCLKDDNCPAYEGKCPLYENCNDNDRKNEKCKSRKSLYCQTKLCVLDHLESKGQELLTNFLFDAFGKFQKKLVEIGFLDNGIDEYDLWSYVAFCNYVQVITSHNKNNAHEIDKQYLEEKINNKGLRANYKNLEPNVIVILYFKEISDIFREKIKSYERWNEFVELTNLNEDNCFYIFAKKDSNLYIQANEKLLEKYHELKKKNVIKRLIDQKKEDGSSYFKESHIAAAVAYYVMKNAENKEIKNQIYNKLQEDFNFFNSENEKDNKRQRNNYFDDIKDLVEQIKNHKEKPTIKPKKKKLLTCYIALEKYLNDPQID